MWGESGSGKQGSGKFPALELSPAGTKSNSIYYSAVNVEASPFGCYSKLMLKAPGVVRAGSSQATYPPSAGLPDPVCRAHYLPPMYSAL